MQNKKKIKIGIFALVLGLFLVFANGLYAEISNNINYQGKLMDNSGNPITTATTIQFSLYNHVSNGLSTDTPGSVGPLLWTETYDGSGGCAQIVPGIDGIFAQHLGDCVPFPAYLDFTQEYYLGVKIGTDTEASPRVPLSTHPYAFTSKRLNARDENIYITSENSGDIILQAADNIILNDTNGEVGTAGQILSSIGGTGGIDWIDVSGLSAGSLWDGDHDTGIQVEKNADDDTIRFDTLGGQRAKIDSTGNVLFSNLDPADLLNPGALTGLLFRNDKASMRVGEATAGTEWNDANIGNGTFASGEDNVVSGWYSSAFGGNNNINDSYSVAMGRNNTITSSYSVAGGFQNSSAGYASMVFGQTNQVSDTRSAAWGLDNTASEREATAWGRNTEASAPYATSWGRNTVASGEHSTAFGYQNTASDDYGLAFGYNNTASGRYATVWGGQNTASGQYSTAFGSHSTASGAHSLAVGFYSEASAENGVAIGDALANSNYMTALGRFNENVAGQSLTNWVDTDQLFVIGNGTGWQNANRSNALTILKNGTITAPSFSLAEINTAGNTALTTKEYVDNAILSGTNNIYTADGTLTSNRTIGGGGNPSDSNMNFYWFDNFDIGTQNFNLTSSGSAFFRLLGGDVIQIEAQPGMLEFNGNTQSTTYTDNKYGSGSGLPAGILYNADYSSEFGNRSLVDKGYVDNQISTGVATASNGLTKTGTDIQLGGNLTKNTSIQGDYIIRFDATDSSSYSSSFVANSTNAILGSGAIANSQNQFIASQNSVEMKANDNIGGSGTGISSILLDPSTYGLVTTESNQGLRYAADYSANFANRSLVDKEYVDAQLMWEILPANTGGMRIQPKNNSVRQIFVQRDDNSYTQFKVRNDNDTGNGAGAIIELKGSGADYTNNMYIGKYGASFWIPELKDNGAVLTDKNLVIGTASDTKEIHFVTGHSYTNLAPVVIADDEGFRYTSDLSATFVDRTLVDKGYVDNVITAGNIYGTNGILTGDRTVSTGGNNLTFQGTQYSSINLNSGDEIYLENYWSNQRMTWDSLNTHIEQSGGGTSTDFNIGNNVTTITSNYGSFAGFQYGADYSTNYTNRSLVDKEYVDNQVAGNISLWAKTGTNLSPTTTGDDVLLNTGETLSIADMTQGSLMFAGAGGLLSQDNANLFWDDTNDRLGIGTTAPDYTLDVSGEMGVDRHIYHNDDINTYIDFTDDRIRFYTGGRSMIDMQQDNNMVFNEGSTQTDFRFESGNDENLLFLDGSTDQIGIGTASPAYKLEVSGALMLEDMVAPIASTGHSGIYSNGGELYALDASGNSTNISPHNEDGLWHYDSENLKTGKALTVEMELLTKELNKVLGGGYIEEDGRLIDVGENIIHNLELRTSKLENKLDNLNNDGDTLISNENILTKIIQGVRNIVEKVVFTAEVQFEKIVVFMSEVSFSNKVIFEDRVSYKDKDMAGSVTIKKGNKNTEVEFESEFEKPPFVTATANNNYYAFKIQEITKNSFKIKVEKKAEKDLLFTWHALAVDKKQKSFHEEDVNKDNENENLNYNEEIGEDNMDKSKAKDLNDKLINDVGDSIGTEKKEDVKNKKEDNKDGEIKKDDFQELKNLENDKKEDKKEIKDESANVDEENSEKDMDIRDEKSIEKS